MARLPEYLTLKYIGTGRLEDGQQVADFEAKVKWWGWPLLFLWWLFHLRTAGYWASQDECDGMRIVRKGERNDSTDQCL